MSMWSTHSKVIVWIEGEFVLNATRLVYVCLDKEKPTEVIHIFDGREAEIVLRFECVERAKSHLAQITKAMNGT